MPFYKVLPKTFKKLVLVLAISALVTEASKEDVVLKKIPYIYYPFCFHKDKKNEVRALINSNSKFNAMKPAYISKLGLRVRRTNVGAQKIDNFTFEMFGIVLASFQV